MTSDAYLRPATAAEAELRERRSRFLAFVSPAADEASATEVVEAVRRRFPDATHHCWAWRLGAEARERSSDAGEPPGTAGAPMLRVLRGAGLSDAVAVVARWFGGTKLGRGGLARAYSGALKEAVARLDTVAQRPTVRLEIELPYDRLGAVQRLVHPPDIEIAAAEYGRLARLILSVERDQLAVVEETLAALGVSFRRRPEGQAGSSTDPPSLL